MKVRVLRPFLLDGGRVEPGNDIELPDHFARELVACNKAEPAAHQSTETVAPPGPMTTTTAAAVVQGKTAPRRKSKEF